MSAALTPDQAKAAYANTSVAVRAGAGTGKTHMLTERYVFHLRQGLSPLEIVAVTFTERAASELRARIRTAVAQASDIPEDALFELEAAPIGTIHGLAASICRAHPDAANVPADFVILDALEGSLWQAEYFENALANLPEETVEVLPYSQLRTVLEHLLNQPHSAKQALSVGSDGWEALARQAREAAKMSLADSPQWRDACDVLARCSGAEGDKAEAARKQALACVDAFDMDEMKQALELADAINLRGGSKNNWQEEALALVKDAIKVVRNGLKRQREALLLELSLADDLLAAILPTVQEAFARVERALQAAKRDARVLDFNDLEQRALLALQNDKVQKYYHNRFRAVLMDEVQDTSPIQAAIIDALTEQATVTIVGDEKQSIYGFRGADVRVFERLQAQFAAGGEVVSLATSFRIHASLMAHLNHMTVPLLGERHQALEATRPAPDNTSAGNASVDNTSTNNVSADNVDVTHVGVYVLAGEALPNKAFRQVSEARHLAELIQKLLDAKTPVFDKATQQQRALALGDIAILTRTWKPLDTYSDVLPALGVPALHTGGGNLLETREAKDMLAALCFFADARDDLALAALLKSPYFALSDGQLSDIAAVTSEEECWFDTLQTQPPESTGSAAEVLVRLHGKRFVMSASQALQRLDALTGYSAVIANLPGAARRVADYRAFVDFVRGLEPGSDTFTVVRRLKRLWQAEVNVARPSLQADDAVTLMTIHRAKGLEFPLVILADLDYTMGNQTPAALIDAELGVAFKVADEQGEMLEPVLYQHLKNQQRQAEADELRRVLYVGLTRARDWLYLSATKGKGGALELLFDCLDAANIPINEVTFTPESAFYPQAHPVSAAKSELGDLWQAPPLNVDINASKAGVSTESSRKSRAKNGQATPWDDVREWLMMCKELRWLPLLDVLEQANLPLPNLDASMLPLTQNSNPTTAIALLVWDNVALAEKGTPPLDYDLQVLFVDEDNPDAVIDPLRERLSP